uniref:Uncharacterized protein n=1 Tax=Meloidogyne incognita TaxID=6306 RepID=A0A914LYG6_MELIC
MSGCALFYCYGNDNPDAQDWKKQSMFEGLPTAQMPSSSQVASMQRRPYFRAESSGMQSNPDKFTSVNNGQIFFLSQIHFIFM